MRRFADWGPLATAGTNWDVFISGFGGDISNMGGPAIDQNGAPNSIGDATGAGFRCAK